MLPRYFTIAKGGEGDIRTLGKFEIEGCLF